MAHKLSESARLVRQVMIDHPETKDDDSLLVFCCFQRMGLV